MTIMIRHNTTGEVQCVDSVDGYDIGDASDQWTNAGAAIDGVDPSRQTVDGSGAVIVNLGLLKTERGAEGEAYRDTRVNGGCATPSGAVDSDEISRALINGAVSMAVIAKAAGIEFSTTWRLADNSYVTLDADAMIAVGVAVGQFVSDCYSASFAVKDAITAAATADAITAIDITAGYPI